ncbi:MAG: hypothetical protein V3T83_17910 [Acidobacteriota bacterium]
MNGENRFLRSNRTVVLACKVLLAAFAVAVGALDTARADKIFAHGAAGQGDPFSFKTEIVLGSNFVSANLLVPATGEVRFFRPDGTPRPLIVTGPIAASPNCVGNLCTSFRYSVVGPTQFILDSDDPISDSAFWTRVEEDQLNRTRAALKFVLLKGATEVSVADVPPSDARERHGFFVTGPVSPGQLRFTGIAISNPSGAQARYAAVALDELGNQAATAEFFLGANQQTARFVNELFVDSQGDPVLPDDFTGSVQVLSDRDSSSVALLQTIEDLGDGDLTITISAIRTDDESEVPIPFLVGKAAEFGEGQPGGGELQVIASDGIHPRGQVGGGRVSLRRGNEVLRGTIAQDGSILIGPVPNGGWTLNIRVPGFLPFEQPLDFPAAPFNIDLIPLALVNPAWFEETLQPPNRPDLQGRVFKPRRQFRFIFDTGSFDRTESAVAQQNIQRIRDAFKQWVFFELPQLRIPVLDDKGAEAFLGGRRNYSEINLQSASGTTEQNTIIVSANLRQNSLLDIRFDFSDQTFSVDAVTLLFFPENAFSPSCAPNQICDISRIVSAAFWNLIFMRNFNDVNLDLETRPLTGLPGEEDVLTPLFTQITSNPASFTSTGLDRNYWRILVRRPPGTLITADGEFLPKAHDAQASRSGRQGGSQSFRVQLLPWSGKRE